MGNLLIELSAYEAARAIAQRKITSHQLVAECLERIKSREPEIGAWEFLDEPLALAQADQRDNSGEKGALHGVPIGIKDIIETADMPTGHGSPIYRNNRTGADAACVRRLRAAGAIILGKTVTAEFATFYPGKTRNPHNSLHTPGGSSSGSAAAVAGCHVPVALGTQTAGSVIRPASFCGVIGYKPSYARFAIDGVLSCSPALDTLGIFARSVDDIELVAYVLGGISSREIPAIAAPPRIGVVRTPWWHEAEAEMRNAVESSAETLARSGAIVSELTTPEFEELRDAHSKIMFREIAISRRFEYENHRPMLSGKLVEVIEHGRALGISEIQNAIRTARIGRGRIAQAFRVHDVLLTPSAPGAAPEGLSSTGNPIFNGIWTLLGVPCITYPAAFSSKGLPLGVQVIGPPNDDERLIAATRWMQQNSASDISRCGSLVERGHKS
jgi:Asp-tRNA(Asn)/Glu-tRNA(Gln) amidotransferase A subunit family amidase